MTPDEYKRWRTASAQREAARKAARAANAQSAIGRTVPKAEAQQLLDPQEIFSARRNHAVPNAGGHVPAAVDAPRGNSTRSQATLSEFDRLAPDAYARRRLEVARHAADDGADARDAEELGLL